MMACLAAFAAAPALVAAATGARSAAQEAAAPAPRPVEAIGRDAATLAPLYSSELVRRFLNTRYGSPLAYARALEIVSDSGMTDLSGRRVLDVGYGGIGHLRLMASLGAEFVGVEVDPLLALL
ncbi:MAG TPA: hypothetical protein VFP98_02545 [Candidatus Polarisedimenticolia bacterium]|nr:hypothetical protein [Candidatus Polarisedimenticolia bacterium]